ncbi:ATP-dependent zinc protease family protein [Paraglaciecola arctica]|uniref:Possible ribosomal protein S6 modification protein n=1 Tax=Paraglaciecola arctica BSs20135 TaxID=493475 RepID=K6YE35_9ALTE|nr:RimK/LysX family protein [Paraglaciecola arctica]GAC22226.1 possible ribosomal protein S6 modification protein [Paraglaciecola arctica BSs20135]
MNKKHLVGALELCDLPQLKLNGLEARVDTGATTSSLHVDNIVKFKKEKEKWVRFDIHPDSHDVSKLMQREAKVKSVRKVKSSNATKQTRYVIETDISIAGMQWGIELTLTDRSEMKYLMLLGREAMSGRLIVDPEHEFLLTE